MTTRSIAALSLLLVVGLPHVARATSSVASEPSAASAAFEVVPDRPRLRLGLRSASAIAGGALALWAASAAETGTDHVASCRWCEPGRFDLRVRDQLRWRDGDAAGDASDVLLLAVPLGAAAAVAWLGARDGGSREAIEDVLIVAAALAVTDPITTGVKHRSGRLRPGPWAAGGSRTDGDLHSFVSGHTSRVFAAAAAASQVLRLRRRRGWRWVAAAGFTAAAATGWLRMAADQHWATDVLAGAALGTAMGWAVPSLALRAVEDRSPGARLVPAPGGLALVF